MKNQHVIVVLALSCCVALPAGAEMSQEEAMKLARQYQAQSAGAAEQPPEAIELTEKDVTGLIGALDELEELGIDSQVKADKSGKLEMSEALAANDEALSILHRHGFSPEHFQKVAYSVGYAMAALEKMKGKLTAEGIPFRLFGGQQFFDRKEVKDTAAYLRFVVNPWDELSLRRVINFPARGIGAKSVERIENHARARGIPFVKAIATPQSVDGLRDVATRGLGEFGALVKRARATLKSSGTLHAATRALVDDVGLSRALDDTAEGGNSGEQRYRNVLRLLDWLERYEANAPRALLEQHRTDRAP